MWISRSIFIFTALFASADASTHAANAGALRQKLSEVEIEGNSMFSGQARGSKVLVDELLQHIMQGAQPATIDEEWQHVIDLFDNLLNQLGSEKDAHQAILNDINNTLSACVNSSRESELSQLKTDLDSARDAHSNCRDTQAAATRNSTHWCDKLDNLKDTPFLQDTCNSLTGWTQYSEETNGNFMFRVDELQGYFQTIINNLISTKDEFQEELDKCAESSSGNDGHANTCNRLLDGLEDDACTLRDERTRENNRVQHCENQARASQNGTWDSLSDAGERRKAIAAAVTTIKCMAQKSRFERGSDPTTNYNDCKEISDNTNFDSFGVEQPTEAPDTIPTTITTWPGAGQEWTDFLGISSETLAVVTIPSGETCPAFSA